MINISVEHKFSKIVKFAVPSIMMMMFLSLYVIVDGIFVSRFVSTDALSALNIVYPLFSIVYAISIMFGTGGNAIVSKQLGEGKKEKANHTLSLIVVVTLVVVIIFSAIVLAFGKNILHLLGANDVLMPMCLDYMYLFAFAPLAAFQCLYQSFYSTIGKGSLGLIVTIVAGIINIALDYLFIVVCKMGILGAALGTGISFAVSAIVGTITILLNKKGLHYKSPYVKGENAKIIGKTMLNGSSEMVISLSASVVNIIYNIWLMKLIGPDGVAAITIVFYAQFMFCSFFMGYSLGIAPILAYNYGARNYKYINSLTKKSFTFLAGCCLTIFALSLLLAKPVASIFTPKDSAVFDISVRALTLFSITYLFNGINIFSSGLFTALSDGITSGVISFCRTFVFAILSILIFGSAFGTDGLWIAIPIAELITVLMVATILIIKTKKKSMYINNRPKSKIGNNIAEITTLDSTVGK